MAVEWTDNLAVGVGVIDDQHKTLFDKANQLFEAGKNNKSKEFISEMLDFLDKYTKQHFRDEESYMKSINYPGYEDQKKLHANFIMELDKLKKEYSASGGNIIVILNANQMVVDWLLKHISIEDKKIGIYANNRNR
ncbi:bacteriohemerythrin [Sinanaerobacter chloroacetimidivorans]|jgi:hemerythrin|uniref:Hemerythrin family protein n=1 Tax=Sinanaerobacter chloroacetimidivorans TaxID=2818044 RepID=A0A8J7W752_9FIRM|nr:bacteriohemerythrin [Sinanaerobacter chloroacetimidivorans]MBR0600360.1 hemerythrin family protein [Sinanaerobacter chloroacetimidivorans]